MHFTFFLIQLRHSSKPALVYKGKKDGTIAVFANGPSLKEEIIQLNKNGDINTIDDVIVMNFMAFDDVFFKIKPKHYCFADYMFFNKSHKIEDVRKLFSIIENKVDWNMNIYVPSHYFDLFTSFSGIKNNKIKIVRINTIKYRGFDRFKFLFFKKGLSCPKIQTVANLAIFIGINNGFSNIRLYGVDHSFFKSLCVNEMNQLCNFDTHFYDNKLSMLKPIRRTDTGEVIKISKFLEDRMLMFKSHDQLAEYAKSVGTNIVNFTKKSMIDSYERYRYKY